MSAPEVTAAVQRARDEGMLAHTRATADPHIPQVWQYVTVRMLAAALVVGEMARAMCLSTVCDGSRRSCPDYSANVQRATALRAAMLGEYS